jgi:nifR3 family TIM-barrel protein
MRIYNHEFRNGLFLAPLSGYTNYPMRLLCRRYGAELAYTEMLSATGLSRKERNTRKLLERPEGDRPLIAQIFGSDPCEMALAARMLQDKGFDGIDINMGCPVKKVVYKGAGAALMKTPDTARKIVEAVCGAIGLPVSVKMRSGWDESSMNADELAPMLTAAGASAVIIHPRTRSDMYRNTPFWDMLGNIRGRVDAPIIASGDIKRQNDVEMLAGLGADAFMIGRAAIGRPWVFMELSGGPAPSMDERCDVVIEHLDMLCGYLGTGKAMRYMRKFISMYVKGMDGASGFRQKACMMDDHGQLKIFIRDFFRSQS